ncbi:MAG: hypothetical protein QXT46_01530 [Pyrobaculum sp.]
MGFLTNLKLAAISILIIILLISMTKTSFLKALILPLAGALYLYKVVRNVLQ